MNKNKIDFGSNNTINNSPVSQGSADVKNTSSDEKRVSNYLWLLVVAVVGGLIVYYLTT